jgi:hypothetical protein
MLPVRRQDLVRAGILRWLLSPVSAEGLVGALRTGAGADTGFWVSAIPKELSLAVKLARQSLRDRRLHTSEVCASPEPPLQQDQKDNSKFHIPSPRKVWGDFTRILPSGRKVEQKRVDNPLRRLNSR